MAKLVRGERYHDLEDKFIESVCARAGLITNGRDAGPLIAEVRERLTKGAREYGDAQFWHADCLQELREECLDLIGWGSLQYVKYLEAGERTKATRLSRIIADAVRIHTSLSTL